jgi:hypothetical protein
MNDLRRFSWKCTFAQCDDTLAAYSEESLEVIKGLHLEGHSRAIDRAQRLAGLCAFSIADAKFLRDIGIDCDGRDSRTQDELAKRYRGK